MAPEKRNEFLDNPESDSEQDDGYNSEDEIVKGGRSAKRRRVDSDGGSDEGASDPPEQSGDEELGEDDDGVSVRPATEAQIPDEDTKSNKKRQKGAAELLPDISRPLTKKNLVASEAAVKKSGVVYLSRVPPFMKPIKVRSLLEPYGTINRIFLAPEDPAAYARRVRSGGNKKRSFTEGWIEFVKKKDAKAVCELLNARPIGGKKGGYYHDDIWNLLYLKGFKWHHLTEQIAAENAEHASRMRAEISKTTKENKEFVKNVERAKMLEGMQTKAKKRKPNIAEAELPREAGRTFRQVAQVKKDSGVGKQPENVTRVLSKIF